MEEHPISEAFQELDETEVTHLKEKYDRTIQGELEQLKAAYASEFAIAEGESRDLATKARKELQNHAIAAANRLVYLMNHAEKHDTQLRAATFIYEHSVEQILAGENDSVNDLISRLRSEPASAE